MESQGNNERRRQRRINVDYKLTLEADEKQKVFGTILNISEGGLQIMTLDQVVTNEESRLYIHLPEQLADIFGAAIDVTGQWRWMKPFKERADSSFHVAGFEFNQEQLPGSVKHFIERAIAVANSTH
jgi:hypothetical protein